MSQRPSERTRTDDACPPIYRVTDTYTSERPRSILQRFCDVAIAVKFYSAVPFILAVLFCRSMTMYLMVFLGKLRGAEVVWESRKRWKRMRNLKERV